MGSSRRQSGDRPAPRSFRRIASGLALSLAATAPAGGVDLGGSIQLFWSTTDLAGQSSEFLDQRYSLLLEQRLTEFFSLGLALRQTEQETAIGGGATATRRNRNPRLDLRYQRPEVSAVLSFEHRRIDGTFAAEAFEARSVTGTLNWEPLARLRLNLGYRDARNEGDVGAFGRGLDERQARAQIFYDREFWGASYGFTRSELDNRERGLDSEQDRHDLRLYGSRRLLNGRLSLGFSGQAGRVERRVRQGGVEFADPLAAARGLFAVDPTPELGELESAPGLIDGDTATPTSPPIEIGGGNTSRNVGVDLGVIRPATRLEIYVDGSSGPDLVWEVYRSGDNLFWEPVAVVVRTFDTALLRYTLRFPQVSDRYLKAVNVSANPAADVRVTEVRALLDRDLAAGQPDTESELYRVDLSGAYQIGRRTQIGVDVGGSNDESIADGLTRQDFRTSYARAVLSTALAPDLRLTLDHSVSDTEDRLPPRLLRTVEESSASLLWTPLPTVDAAFTAGLRDEYDDGELLQTNTTSRLGLGLQLLPTVRLDSQLSFGQLEDFLGGTDRETWTWSQRVSLRPLDTWTVRGGYNWQVNEVTGQERLLERTHLFVESDWNPGSRLSLSGAWRFFDDEGGDSLRQTYGLFFTPGPKLTLSLGLDEFDSQRGRRTANDSVTATYRLVSRALFSGSLSRSRTELDDGSQREISSLRLGITIFF